MAISLVSCRAPPSDSAPGPGPGPAKPARSGAMRIRTHVACGVESQCGRWTFLPRAGTLPSWSNEARGRPRDRDCQRRLEQVPARRRKNEPRASAGACPRASWKGCARGDAPVTKLASALDRKLQAARTGVAFPPASVLISSRKVRRHADRACRRSACPRPPGRVARARRQVRPPPTGLHGRKSQGRSQARLAPCPA